MHRRERKKEFFFPTFEAGMLLKIKARKIENVIAPDKLMKVGELYQFSPIC